MEAPEPGRNGSVKNLHCRSKSEGSLSSDLPPEQRQLFQELNVDDTLVNDTQGSSVKKRKLYLELNVAAQEWTVLRLLIPTNDDDAINSFKCQIRQLETHYEKKNVEVDFYSATTGVGVVMVSAKRDSRHAVTHVVNAFDEVHRYFLHTMSNENCLTRLLVPASHAKKLIILYTIKSDNPCQLTMYLTDNISVFFPGDVIIDVEGNRKHVHARIESIVPYLVEFAVDESMMSEFKAGNGIRPSYPKIYTPGKAPSCVKAQRDSMVHESTEIPLSYIDYLIGEDGTNIKMIWKSSPTASVSLNPFTLKEVIISIEGEGDLEVEDAQNAIEVQLWNALSIEL
ncbi:unnamed protein product [Cuscuta campestris]|uniref:K Homology domain-containing protein n=1 Tax=Cuscuta campestris TaxID=132261 RepID=A0A484LVJ4_9ASTE|nr:unnamed protein product [Cuscuta campestris]